MWSKTHTIKCQLYNNKFQLCISHCSRPASDRLSSDSNNNVINADMKEKSGPSGARFWSHL